MIVRPADEDFPFCSDRCRKIDSPILDPEVLEDLGGLGTDRSGGSDEG
jgi:hypothetical protein